MNTLIIFLILCIDFFCIIFSQICTNLFTSFITKYPNKRIFVRTFYCARGTQWPVEEEDAAAGRSLHSRRGKLRAPTTAVRASHRRRGAAPFRPDEARRRVAGGRRRRRARLHPPRTPDGAPPPDPHA